MKWPRARELQAEDRLGGARYRPPALRVLAQGGSPPDEISSPSDGSTLPPTNYPAGFRRARAGTLPSNVQLAAQRFAAASNTLSSTPGSTESFQEQSQAQLQSPAAPSPSIGIAPTRPGLRHSASVASSVPSSALTERNSRLRSGSLTLPTGGLSNAFGPSIFSSSWLSSTNGGSNGFPVLDELRSVTSADSGADEFDVHTLDYLGLDDSHRPPPAATISELRNQAQAAIAGNLAANPPRMRASTVSTPYARMRTSAGGSLLSTPNAEEEEEFFYEQENDYEGRPSDRVAYERQRLNSFDPAMADSNYTSSYGIAKGFKQADHLAVANGLAAARPRAISVGNLDDPLRSVQRRSTVAEAPQSSYLSDQIAQSPIGILKGHMSNSRGTSSPTVHFPSGELSRASSYLVAPTSTNRSVSPKSEGASSQIQTPTRSLWIGNLDSAVTSEQLIHVFAPYGAIESLRLLPEKVRGIATLFNEI
jgi:protein JSN1